MKVSQLMAATAATFLTVGAAVAGPINITSVSGMPALSGSLDVVENTVGNGGDYDVTNNTGGSLIAFGVSNNIGSDAGLYQTFGFDSDFGCANPQNFFQICYDAQEIYESDWDSEIAFFSEVSGNGLTFQSAFGNFADVVGGDTMFNWYTAVDGSLQDGDSIDGFFGFQNALVASNIIGVSANAGGAAAFSAGAVTAPGGPLPAVPLPAAGWMLLAGLGGLAAAGRRRKTT